MSHEQFSPSVQASFLSKEELKVNINTLRSNADWFEECAYKSEKRASTLDRAGERVAARHERNHARYCRKQAYRMRQSARALERKVRKMK